MIQATCYKLLAMSFEIQVTSYKLRSVTCKSCLRQLMMVQYLDGSMIIRCKIVPYITADQRQLMIVQYRCCTQWWASYF
jgi:hypothetical protein